MKYNADNDKAVHEGELWCVVEGTAAATFGQEGERKRGGREPL